MEASIDCLLALYAEFDEYEQQFDSELENDLRNIERMERMEKMEKEMAKNEGNEIPSLFNFDMSNVVGGNSIPNNPSNIVYNNQSSSSNSNKPRQTNKSTNNSNKTSIKITLT